MREDFKSCFRLMKYSCSYKDETITSIVMFVLGVILFLADCISPGLSIGPSLLVVLAPTLFIKSIFALPYSYMVCSSKKRKLLELTFSNIWTVCSILFGYMIWILLIIGFVLSWSPEREAEVARCMIWSCLLHVSMLLFSSISTRLYWQGIIFIAIAAMSIMLGEILWDEVFAGFTKFGPAAVTGFVITLAGALLSCVLRALVYKKPMVRGRIGKQMLGVQ